MRRLFLLLLAVNVIFFSWNWFKGNDDTASPYRNGTTLSPNGKNLLLLSELKPAPGVEPAPGIEPSPEIESPLEDESSSTPKPANPVPKMDPQSTEPEKPAEKPAPAAPRPPPPTARDGGSAGFAGAKSHPTARDGGSAGFAGAKSHPAVTVTKPPQTTAHEAGLCYVLGPFASGAEVQRVVTRTATTVAIVERRWSSPRQRPGYWVHIPPAASGREARDIINALNAADVSDVRMITSGEMKYAVSLGIFSTIENARKRLAEVQKHGIDVAINEVRIRKRQYWLALRGSRDTRLPRVMLNNLLKGIRGAKVERRPCANLYR